MAALILEPGRSEKNYWRDLFHYRELFLILAWRDVAVRYKQTSAGAAWAILQPLMSMLIMTVIFGRLAGLPAQDGAPYAIMVLSALLPWQFFSNALSLASQSVVTNSNLISKIYFPRLIIPSSSVVVSLVDFLVASSIMAGLMVWYHFSPTWRLIVLPALVLLAIAAAMGPSLIITALTVKYRDFRILVPFVIQFGMYVCPVGYSSDLVHEKLGDKWFMVYSLNPMVGVIDGFRWAILGNADNAARPFNANQIKNFPEFIAKLQNHTDPVSTLLEQRLNAPRQMVLTNYTASTNDLELAKQVVAQDLNGLIEKGAPPLYDAARFKDVSLRPETSHLLEMHPQGKELTRLNRLLLEDNYANDLTRSSSGFYWQGFLLSVCLTTVLLVYGIYYFRKTERAFADII